MPQLEIITPAEWGDKKIVSDQINTALKSVYTNSTLYDRLDKLIDLVDACAAHQPEHEAVNALQAQAEQFIAIIANTTDVAKAIESRKNVRALWPTYLPNTSLSHLRPLDVAKTRSELVKMRVVDHLKAFVGVKTKEMKVYSGERPRKLLTVNKTDLKLDKELKVKMLEDLEKEQYRVLSAKGMLWQLQQPQNESSRLTIQPFDTTNYTAHKHEGRAIFVLTPQGELFSGSSEIGIFHHSSFQKGGYVAYGGSIEVKDGAIKYIDDYSGHYTPKGRQLFLMLKEFKRRDLIKPDTVVLKKFDESALHSGETKGIKVTSTQSGLNTLGFLRFSSKTPSLVTEGPETIDHYQVLQEFVLNNAKGEDDPALKMFAVIMREYLADKQDDETLKEHYTEVCEFATSLEIAEDFVEKNPEEYAAYLKQLKSLIEMNSELKEQLGGDDWLAQATEGIKQTL